MADVVLITMPWDLLSSPSLALGILHQLLADAGVDVASASYKLAWMELVLQGQRASSRQPITIADYEEIARAPSGVGDWVFAAPPISPARTTASYRALLSATGEAHLWPKLAEMRRLVPRFLDECVAEVRAQRPRVVGFTTTFGQNLSSLALARRLKQADPTLRVVFGGAN